MRNFQVRIALLVAENCSLHNLHHSSSEFASYVMSVKLRFEEGGAKGGAAGCLWECRGILLKEHNLGNVGVVRSQRHCLELRHEWSVGFELGLQTTLIIFAS